MARKFSIQQKRDYCMAIEKSGLPASQFCKEVGISVSALRKWRKELSKGELSEGFSPLVLRESPVLKKEDMIQMTIDLPGQMQIRLELYEHRLISLIQELSHATAIIR